MQGKPFSHTHVADMSMCAGNMPPWHADCPSPALYLDFTHDAWGRLRADTPLTLSEADLIQLRGLNERVSLDEVVEIYLPLSRLLNLYVAATQELYRATATFLGSDAAKVPYVIGMAGSVAVGKSTTARILQALLSRWPHHPKVDFVTTDGFLYPNRVLEEHGLMGRKGFPESYDLTRSAAVRLRREIRAPYGAGASLFAPALRYHARPMPGDRSTRYHDCRRLKRAADVGRRA